MGRKPNNARAEAMYLAYAAGLTLKQIGEQFGCSMQAVSQAFKRRQLITRAKATPLEFIEYRGRRYTISKNGYYRCTSNEGRRGVLLHRVLWEEANGPIPPGFHIHHRNGDKTDNRLENLECIHISDHTRFHRTERSVFPDKKCKWCSRQMLPRRDKPRPETPSAFAIRVFCSPACGWKWRAGRPRDERARD